MVFRGIKVKVIRQSGRFVNYMLMSSNSRMRLPLSEFEKNVEDGVYIVHNPEILETA